MVKLSIHRTVYWNNWSNKFVRSNKQGCISFHSYEKWFIGVLSLLFNLVFCKYQLNPLIQNIQLCLVLYSVQELHSGWAIIYNPLL